ncbi:MAG: RHS repeat-associated core domain-containing protein, partial [Thermoplasmata archaeon]|nr:RHS repeat-associated core domain-containing protein [Thermoplasmata archaeon]
KIILPNTDEIEYNYCSFGKRICRIDPTGATFYFYDKEDIITEYDATGTPIKEYLHGPGIDNPISVRTSGQSYFLHKDHLGSIGFITDSAESLIETYDYDEYGAYNGPSNPKSDYLFTGREYEEMAGIYYYRARYYDPEVGRFIQQDPRGLFSGRSLYEYSDSNPVNRIDPYGEATQQTCRAQQEGCVLVANTVQGTCLIGCAGTSFGIGLVVGAVITGPPGWVAGLIGGAVTIGTALACEDACFDIYTANLQTCEDAYDTCMNNAGQVAWNSQPLYNMWKPYHNIEPANPPTRTYTPSGFIMNCYYQGNFRACYIMI